MMLSLDHIGSVLELLSSYSLTVKHLKAILSYLYNGQSDATWVNNNNNNNNNNNDDDDDDDDDTNVLSLQAPHSVLLISLLNSVTINRTPDAFFSFSGGHGSVSNGCGLNN